MPLKVCHRNFGPFYTTSIGILEPGVSAALKKGGSDQAVGGEMNVLERRERQRRRREAPLGGFGRMQPKKIFKFWHINGGF